VGYQLSYDAVLSAPYLQFFLTGVAYTLALTAGAWLASLALAFVLATVGAASNPACRTAVAAYVEYHRNVPLLVQLLIWYFAVPTLLPEAWNQYLNRHNAEVLFALVALGLYSAAYMSEDIRSGLRAIPPSQMEAARALGLGFVGSMRWVIIPQAWRLSVVPLVGQTLILFKATSLGSAIGVTELTYQARQIESQSFRVFEAFSMATAAYMVGSLAIMFGGAALARRYQLARR